MERKVQSEVNIHGVWNNMYMYVVVRKAKAKPKQTKDQLIKELSECNQKLNLEHRKVAYRDDMIKELKKENKVMTRAQRQQQREMDKLNNNNSALKQKLDEREDYIVEQNRNHRQKIKDNRLFLSQQHEQQKKDYNKKIEKMERQYESKMEAVEIDCKKRIAVVECNCAETLEETRVECVKLTSLFKNALATERKKNSMVVGELDAKIEAQAEEFRIELDECRSTFISTMKKQLDEQKGVFQLEKKNGGRFQNRVLNPE